LLTGCAANATMPIVPPAQVEIQSTPIPTENLLDTTVPVVIKTWHVENCSLTTAQNMEQLYDAIKDYMLRDKCGCQKGDPLCDCEL